LSKQYVAVVFFISNRAARTCSALELLQENAWELALQNWRDVSRGHLGLVEPFNFPAAALMGE